uniref:PT domain-containing protein n=1 Tax=Thermobifida halotolerans TaxID=483545 RepID=UPI0018FE6EBA
MRGIVAAGLSAALAFSAISLLAWHNTDRAIPPPEAGTSAVLVRDASRVTGWECFAESSPGSGSAGCSRETTDLPTGLDLAGEATVQDDPDASWPDQWPPPAATRLDGVTGSPTHSPTGRPTDRPTGRPPDRPTDRPTDKPTRKPTASPTERPTHRPTG